MMLLRQPCLSTMHKRYLFYQFSIWSQAKFVNQYTSPFSVRFSNIKGAGLLTTKIGPMS
jgi:hypothetical protein